MYVIYLCNMMKENRQDISVCLQSRNCHQVLFVLDFITKKQQFCFLNHSLHVSIIIRQHCVQYGRMLYEAVLYCIESPISSPIQVFNAIGTRVMSLIITIEYRKNCDDSEMSKMYITENMMYGTGHK